MSQFDNVTSLVGNEFSTFRPFTPYNAILCDLLNDLSVELRSKKESAKYPDIMAFAFWCRTANITKLKNEFDNGIPRLGLGLTFHVTPSNVPINFAFSYAFGLLAGNSNIVRVPSKPFPQIDIVCAALNQVFQSSKYREIEAMTAFIRYEKNDEITNELSANCNARLIWGGNQTIKAIRKFSVPERCIDIAFSDRYSFCVMHAPSVARLDRDNLCKLSQRFYNDSYLIDQNACSSPHLIIWIGDEAETARKKFWSALYQTVDNQYQLPSGGAIDKYTRLCHDAIEFDNIHSVKRHGNHVYHITFDSIRDDMSNIRGQFGYFYECDVKHLNSIASIVNSTYQTLTYFGVEKSELLSFILDNRLSGIDRAVPVGDALDIGVFWDGYDIITSLSRIIDVK